MMSDAVKSDDGWWMFSTPRGPAKLKFNENRSFGILDCVYIDEESKWDVPMRVVPSAEESEIMITLIKPENISDEQFNQRMDEIGQAFSNLKSLIEKPLQYFQPESSTNHSLRLNVNFANKKRTKMPYEEVYFQRMKEEHPDDYEELAHGK